MSGDAKVAIVTGAARGIGRAISANKAGRGWPALLAVLDEPATSATAASLSGSGGFATGHVWCADGGYAVAGIMEG